MGKAVLRTTLVVVAVAPGVPGVVVLGGTVGVRQVVLLLLVASAVVQVQVLGTLVVARTGWRVGPLLVVLGTPLAVLLRRATGTTPVTLTPRAMWSMGLRVRRGTSRGANHMSNPSVKPPVCCCVRDRSTRTPPLTPTWYFQGRF